MARQYRDSSGNPISQSAYLDLQAQKAGYANRAERQRVQKQFAKAAKTGAAPPTLPAGKKAPKPLPAGAPGGRGRKAPTPPANRAKDVWHKPREGFRVKTTGSAANALSAIKGAHRNKELVFLTVKGDIKAQYEQKVSDQGEAGFRHGVDPSDLLAAIDAANGDVKQGIADLLMSEGKYDSVSNLRSFTIRAYS